MATDLRPTIDSKAVTTCFWPWSHKWAKWTDKSWSKLVRDRPLFSNVTSSHVETPSEVGLECIQERRCTACNKLQLRSEQVRL